MDILKRNLAPLSEEAWREIDARTEQVLKSSLSVRKAVKVVGPKGWDYTALSEGRLDIKDNGTGDEEYGVYKVLPLTETRINFTLNRFELDYIARGAKDVGLSNLESAAEKAAKFEDNAVLNGLSQGNIKGLVNSTVLDPIPMGNDAVGVMRAITSAYILLRKHFEQGPFTLIAGEKLWKIIHQDVGGYPLRKRIEDVLGGGNIVFSSLVEGGLLIPYDNENLELTIGHDFAVGYHLQDEREIKLFITESFTFRVLDENLIVLLKF